MAKIERCAREAVSVSYIRRVLARSISKSVCLFFNFSVFHSVISGVCKEYSIYLIIEHTCYGYPYLWFEERLAIKISCNENVRCSCQHERQQTFQIQHLKRFWFGEKRKCQQFPEKELSKHITQSRNWSFFEQRVLTVHTFRKKRLKSNEFARTKVEKPLLSSRLKIVNGNN